jgi:hypothetical protein
LIWRLPFLENGIGTFYVITLLQFRFLGTKVARKKLNVVFLISILKNLSKFLFRNKNFEKSVIFISIQNDRFQLVIPRVSEKNTDSLVIVKLFVVDKKQKKNIHLKVARNSIEVEINVTRFN